MGEIKVGDIVVFEPVDSDGNVYKRELGVVKRAMDGKCFVAYGTGDTCCCTQSSSLHPVDNQYAAKALCKRAEQLGNELWDLCENAEDWSVR